MTIRIAFSRWWWTFLSVGLGLWTMVGIIGLALLAAGISHPTAGRAAVVAIAVPFAIVGLVGGFSAYRIARSHPCITVEGSVVTIHHPGVLRRPLVLDRKRVHAFYFQPTLDSEQAAAPLPISIHFAPDLSLRNDRRANVLIVLAKPLALTDWARFGLTLWNITLRGAAYYGTTRGTVAHGFFAQGIADPESPLLATWRPTQFVAPESLWNWLGGWADEPGS